MDTFYDLYLLDLHGNSNKKERTPEGGKDENVFDIQQGVAVCLYVKSTWMALTLLLACFMQTSGANVMRGRMVASMDGCPTNDVASTPWAELAPTSPRYLFMSREMRPSLKSTRQGWV